MSRTRQLRGALTAALRARLEARAAAGDGPALAGEPRPRAHPAAAGRTVPDAALADLATCLWRLRARPADPDRDLDAAFDALAGAGIEVRDHDGDPYDPDQPVRAVRFEPDAGADRDRVVETVRPTVYRGGEVIQPGEVVVATPAAPPQPG
jgi:hypothetical protein